MSDDRAPHGSEAELEELLLRAGRTGAPEGAKRRALLAASTLGAASTLAAAEGAAALARTGSIAALKLVGVLGLSGVGAAAGFAGVRTLHSPHPAPASVSAPARAAGPRPSAIATAPAFPSETVPPSPVASVAETPSLPAVEPAVPPLDRRRPERSPSAVSSLPMELAALDGARAAMRSGDAARSLAMVDDYGRRFPHGALQEEAALVRIEALLGSGERAAAERDAREFLARNPASPYWARVRSMFPASNP